MLYDSFRHAQGDQRLQIHFLQGYIRLLREKDVVIDLAARDELLSRIRTRRLPRGHVEIPSARQVSAQFEFWWLTMWDLLISVYSVDCTLVPSLGRLVDRMHLVGGAVEMSSFTPVEMSQIDEGLAPYRERDSLEKSAESVIKDYFLENLIRVEWNFQGNGGRYPARPRTDGGDLHESKMLYHCTRAAEMLPGQARSPVNEIYSEVSKRLHWLAVHRPQDPTQVAHRELVESYNRNHRFQPVLTLAPMRAG